MFVLDTTPQAFNKNSVDRPPFTIHTKLNTLVRVWLHQELPIEYTAISARNLFECYLIAAYIISDPSDMKKNKFGLVILRSAGKIGYPTDLLHNLLRTRLSHVERNNAMRPVCFLKNFLLQ